MLNRCPSCQASVLDDDAEVCPFCGSPMDPTKAKGFKPAAAATVAKPTVPKAAPKAAGTPSAKAGTDAKKPAVPKASSSPGDDDPFAVDRNAGAGALVLSPKRTPQRPHKVVCPMCDTPGYAAETASGKEVRCANPNCMVPVFKAPDFAAPKPAEPEPPASAVSPTALTFGAVALILLGGAAFWWFGLRDPAAVPPGAPTASAPPPAALSRPHAAEKPDTSAEPAEQGPTAPSPTEVVAAALGRWPDVAGDIAQPQRQPLRRRYSAESFALAGRRDAAREQIDQLAAIPSADPFYRVTPLAELAWAHVAAGDEPAGRAAFDQAAPLAEQIPRQGFDPARVAIDWSAAAARFGRDAAARDLAREPRDDAASEQLLAALRSAALFQGGDLDAEASLMPVRPWAEPKTVAVTFELLDRGAADAAKSWAGGAGDSIRRAESSAAWVEAEAAASEEAGDARAAAVESGLSAADPAEQAYALARAAVRLAGTAEGKPAAEAMLARSKQAAGQFPSPAPVAVGDMAAVSREELPDPAGPVLRGAALGEAAHAAALLGRTDEASTLLTQALDHYRAAGPSPVSVRERSREFETLGISGVQSSLKAALGLTSDDQARQAANAYRRKLQEFQAAADARFEAQTELLVRAAGWGIGATVVSEARGHSSAADVDAKEPYLSGAAGGRLLAAFRSAGDTAAAEAVTAAGVTDRDIPPAASLALALAAAPAAAKPTAFAQEIFSPKHGNVSSGERLAAAVKTAARLLKSRSTGDAYAFAGALRDDASREEVLRYLSRFAGASGKGGEVQALLPKLRLTPTAEAAVLRGLVEGAAASPEAP